MKQLQNTLYITLEDVYLAVSGENILIKQNDKILTRYPLHNLDNIVLFSYLGMSPKLVQKCIESEVGISYMTPNGKFIARIQGETKGNVLLRRSQYRLADQELDSLSISRNMILAKIYNEKWVIERYIRQYGERVDIKHMKGKSDYLTKLLKTIPGIESFEELRGIEGLAQVNYFSCFDEMILNQRDSFRFEKRSRRPPLNPVNAMLSYVYAILSNEVASAIESVGLDPYVGFMHTDRPGRISLALDLIEELRAPIADRFVLSLINNRQIKETDFVEMGNGAVLIKDDAKRSIIQAWQTRKQEELTHPFLKEKIKWGLVPFTQALLLARFLRGDLEGYPPFMWK